MKILGIDPGSRSAGYALIERRGRSLYLLDSGTMRYNRQTNFNQRLGLIYQSCIDLITKYDPDEIAIESLIYAKNVTSLMKLSQARGAMIAAFMYNKKYLERLFEYSPNLIKASVTGHGHASKVSVQKTLIMIFGEKVFKTNDESDALAIATCHALRRPIRDVVKPPPMESAR
ncbi:MAG: crossover junction endodeoxyribonuclease RuvC [Bacteriovoracaceae bacterium]|nr:crossover junction endodeoxyribonuclease RuvC [Bacteriovoracaceae bacterium]